MVRVEYHLFRILSAQALCDFYPRRDFGLLIDFNMNDLDEDVTEEMARDAARLWKSCTSGDAIGEGEFTELECLTDECSSTGSQCPFGRGSARLLRLLRARLVL